MPSMNIFDESIYDLIPRAKIAPPKAPRHVSKFAGEADPSSAAGGLGSRKKAAATFGRPAELVKPHPAQFLKSHEKEPVLPDPAPPSKTKERVKPAVPPRTEKPVMGLVSSRNYITTNAVETILAKPGKVPPPPVQYTQKPDFGKVPAYIQRNKGRVEEERKKVEEYYAMQKQQELAAAGVVREIPKAERDELLKHLKLKWASVNSAYQKLTFTLDTPAKQKRKEEYERQLTEIEKDIRLLEKGEVILVVDD